MNAFETLGLDSSATSGEVRAAHRELARRWHPDRFQPGPEREWANEKMAEINSAYLECVAKATDCGADEQSILDAARREIDSGSYAAARVTLMRASLRQAEWNYLFARAMLGMGNMDKSRMYAALALRQCPGNADYAALAARLQPPGRVKDRIHAAKRSFLTAARLFINNIRL